MIARESAFREEVKGIFRLKVPFDKIYTSVFLIVSDDGAFLVDCATTATDIDGHILPALRAMGYEVSDLRGVVLTHRHADHAGGLERLLEHTPSLKVIEDVRTLTDGITTYPLSGHTLDSIGILDTRTNTLISGDALQGAGVDVYRCSLQSPEAYLKTLERIRRDEKIEGILFSHPYEPWCRDAILGRSNVLDCLLKCAEYT